MNITILGAGYVGLSNAILLAKNNQVTLVDIDKEKISLLKKKKSPIRDSLIQRYLSKKNLSLTFDTQISNNLSKSKAVLIATPTNFDPKTKSFDTVSIEDILKKLKRNKFSKLVVIRSTVPVGFTEKMQKKYPNIDIAFFPEFLREGNALRDSLYPSRIICGSKTNKARFFLNLLKDSAIKKDIQTQITSSSEAEAIKLFSNMYLAMRIAFFNELDSFSLSKNLHSKEIIDGLSSDPRIGNYYNNPSFGYGGYCLPKDTQQLRQNFKDIPQKLIQATIQSNHLRKKFIVNEILKRKAKIIGIYRLSMKAGSDNWRESAIIDIIKSLKREQNQVIIYEPLLSKKTFMGILVEKDLEKFKNKSKLIVANRFDGALGDNDEILFTRDIFNEN
ncbi:MAG: nucleotide sugar dehydrogenase [Gammaproteobacteria bacterium]